MKRKLAVAITLIAALLVALAALQTAAVGVSRRAGEIKIESWLHASPSANNLSGTVNACFKLKGALADQGGAPTWTDESYADPTDPAAKCGAEGPVGGFVFVPSSANTLATVYAVHTITGEKGQFSITFSGVYNLGPDTAALGSMQGSGTWVITGGTGPYVGLQGEGTWTADASGFPYIRHTEVGQIHFTK